MISRLRVALHYMSLCFLLCIIWSMTGCGLSSKRKAEIISQLDEMAAEVAERTPLPIAGGEVGYQDGPIKLAKFDHPEGIAVDKNGDVYIADTRNNVIRKLSITTNIVSTFAGSEHGYQDGDAKTAKFSGPTDLAIDLQGNLYVVDSKRIRKITPKGTVSTLSGSGMDGTHDGVGTAASFHRPHHLAVDNQQNVYVGDDIVDYIGELVRKITPNGVTSTLAGNASGDTGSNHCPKVGLVEESAIKFIRGIAVDNNNNLFLAMTDYPCENIFKISPSGYITKLPLRAMPGENADKSKSEVGLRDAKSLTMDARGVLITIVNEKSIVKIVPSKDGTVSMVMPIFGGGSSFFHTKDLVELRSDPRRKIIKAAVAPNGALYFIEERNFPMGKDQSRIWMMKKY